ncbi:hypothetical protein NQZ68_031575 [Dissostichus eleginoides]|nr:hypothetical protein NQZ68_031575 [Dissostichus eleginoides]
MEGIKRWEKLSPLPRSQCPVEGGGGTPTTLLPHIFNRFFCLRFTGPPRPLRGNIDGLVLKVKASGVNTRWQTSYAPTPSFLRLQSVPV